MENFRTLRENSSDRYEKGINSYLKSIKENGVKVEGAKYISEDGVVNAVINMRPFLREKVEFEFEGSHEYFNVWYHESSYARLRADDFVEDWNGLQRLKDAVREYIDENDVPRYKAVKSDVNDHSWLLNNNGWM